jgi:magnesium-protoporphyrin IX monomethyl ester (oxidative) cyclase
MGKYFLYRAPHGSVVKRHPCTNVITSRGCPARCNFCSIHTVWGRRFRYHSAERVVEELEVLADEYCVREVQFEDDNLTLRRRRIQDICRLMLARGINLTWSTPNGVAAYALDERTLQLMRAAGCHHITLGVESGSPDTLRHIIRKPVNLDRVRSIVATCRQLDMGVSAFFIVGLPGESRQAIHQTFNFAQSLDVDSASFFIATPYPGTQLYNRCLDTGILQSPVDFSRLRVGQPLISTPDWTAQELAEWVREAQARFYRKAAWRHPVRFFGTTFGKFTREPGYVLGKAVDTVLPQARRQPTPPKPSP